MKSKHSIKFCAHYALLLSLLMGCSTHKNNQKEVHLETKLPAVIVVKNISDSAFDNVPLVVERESLAPLYNDDRPLVLMANEQIIDSQHEDIDGDGAWDQIAFLVDIQANDSLALSVYQAQEELVRQEPRTNIRIAQYEQLNEEKQLRIVQSLRRQSLNLSEGYAKQFQMEGPAWENENIGFRLYFDERNGFDIFGKTTTELVLDKAGVGHNYHELQTWGMDILKVGRSLGAGALAIASIDSDETTLERISNAQTTLAEIIVEGPIRSILRITYEGLSIAGETVTLTQNISIWSEQHYYESKLMLSGANSTIPIAVGFVDFFNAEIQHEDGQDFVSILSYGKQAELDTLLGMGIVSFSRQFDRFGRVGKTNEGIEQSQFAIFELSDTTPLSYQFYAIWEPGQPHISEMTSFAAQVQHDIARAQSVKLSVEAP